MTVPPPTRFQRLNRKSDNMRRNGRDRECPSRNSNRRNARFSTRSSQSDERYRRRAVRSSCADSSDRNRHRRSPAKCPPGDEEQSSIRIPLSGPRQAQIDRYRKYRQPPVGSCQTTNLVGVWKFADTLGAKDSMACRKTTVCRDKWGEQWSSNRVHRAECVDNCQRRGRGAVSRSTVNHINRKEKKNAVNQKTKRGSVGIRGNPTQEGIKSKMRDGTAAPSPAKDKEAGRWRRHSKSLPPPKREAIQARASLRPRESKGVR